MFNRSKNLTLTVTALLTTLIGFPPAGATEATEQTNSSFTCSFASTEMGYEVSWTPASSANKYTIYRSIDEAHPKWIQAIRTPETTFTDETVPASTELISYIVVARRWSNEVSESTCTQTETVNGPVSNPKDDQRPYDVTATSNGSARIELTWATPLAERQPDHVNIQRDGTTIASMPATTRIYTDVPPRGSGEYRVVAMYSDGIAAASDVVTITAGAAGRCRSFRLGDTHTALLWTNAPDEVTLRLSEETTNGYRFLDLMFENNGSAMAIDTVRNWGVEDPAYRITNEDDQGWASERCANNDLDDSAIEHLQAAGLPVLPDGRPGSSTGPSLPERLSIQPGSNSERGQVGQREDCQNGSTTAPSMTNADSESGQASGNEACQVEQILDCNVLGGNLYLASTLSFDVEVLDQGCYHYDSCYEALGIAIAWLPEWTCENDSLLDRAVLAGEVAFVSGVMVVLGPAQPTQEGYSIVTPLWPCDPSRDATMSTPSDAATECSHIQSALDIGPSGIGMASAESDRTMLRTRAAVAIACDLGPVGPTTETWVTAWLVPDQNIEPTSAAINAGLGCVSSQVIGGSLSQTSRVVTIDGLPDKVIDRTDANLADTGETVLGHYSDGYIDLAQERGSTYFDIGDAWYTLSSAQRWSANKRILDTAVATGDQVVLATSRTAIRTGSTLSIEIAYLRANGFVWVEERLMEPG